jgi:branched-chain amino acid transport system substrate-binding protein
MGKEAVRGAQLALAEFDDRVAGQSVELVIAETNAIADSATEAAANLLDHQDCDLIVGPLAGDEGVAIRDFARQRPDDVFINGSSASQALFNPAPNFYSFTSSGAQRMAGLGRYVYSMRGYRRVSTIGAGYSYPYAQVGGFALEFTRAGGEIAEMHWSALGTEDFSPYIDRIPDDLDAVLCVLSGRDCIAFIQQYRELKGDTPIITGQSSADSTTLHFLRDDADWLIGSLVAGSVMNDHPSSGWAAFTARYLAAFPDGLYSPSLFATAYYTAVKAALLALESVGGDLSGGRVSLKRALAAMAFETPTGPVRLDQHRLAIINNFIGEIDVLADGTLYTRMLEEVPEVNSTLGLPEDEYLRIGDFNPHNMPGQYKEDSLADRLKQHRRRSQDT